MQMLANVSAAVRARLAKAFPWAYTTKHDHYADFGWPECIEFQHFYRMYCRNSLAAAAVDKTVNKTWEALPVLWEQPDKPAETDLEKQIAMHFAEKGIWRALMNTDRRGIVGAYAAGIILLRDGQKLDQPVGRITGGVTGIAGIIPAWEGQLQVSEWDSNPASETYAQPLMYQFNEQAVESRQATGKPTDLVSIHPSRVLVWSEDGTVNGRSDLEPGFNNLIDAEKIAGAGGEGFWKTARGSPMLEAPEGMSFVDVQKAMGGATPDEAREKLNEKVDDWQSGFDKALMLGGMTAKPLQIVLPQPKEFFEVDLHSFAASMQIPVKVLIGNITGERASTEDAREWARTCMSRRENLCLPMLEEFVRRLVAFGVLAKKEWTIGWPSLLDATPDELLDRAAKMTGMNAQNGGELVFLIDEIRETAGFATTDETDGWDETEDARSEREAEAADAANVDPEEEQAA